MKRALTISVLSISISLLALAEEPAETADNSAVEPPVELTPEQLAQIEEHRKSNKREFVIQPRTADTGEVRPKRTGKWVERDGDLICDGYLTRVEDEDFCEAEVPADWRPFEFDGRTYFIQPLRD